MSYIERQDADIIRCVPEPRREKSSSIASTGNVPTGNTVVSGRNVGSTHDSDQCQALSPNAIFQVTTVTRQLASRLQVVSASFVNNAVVKSCKV